MAVTRLLGIAGLTPERGFPAMSSKLLQKMLFILIMLALYLQALENHNMTDCWSFNKTDTSVSMQHWQIGFLAMATITILGSRRLAFPAPSCS